MVFRDYNGNPITIEHVHVIEDTQRDGNTALASNSLDGFMPKEYKARFDILKNKVDTMSGKATKAVYTKQS